MFTFFGPLQINSGIPDGSALIKDDRNLSEHVTDEDTKLVPFKKGFSVRRGRVQIKRIENAANMQVTFSKRRSGLLKKAYQLSVLCEAEVALIIFSSTGKISEFASSSMRKILGRYQKCVGEIQSRREINRDVEYWRKEAARTKHQLTLLHERLMQMMGENLAGLSVKDLQKLENELENGITRVRGRKTQALLEQIQELGEREHLLFRENEVLRCKVNNLVAMNPHDVQDCSSIKATSETLAPVPQNESSITAAETTLQLGSCK